MPYPSKNPKVAALSVSGARKIAADPAAATASERMRKLHADPEFAARHKASASERMRKLNADPEFAQRRIAAVRISMARQKAKRALAQPPKSALIEIDYEEQP